VRPTFCGMSVPLDTTIAMTCTSHKANWHLSLLR